MKKVFTLAVATIAMALSSLAQAQTTPPGFEGIWQTKEWFGTVANMQFVACQEGPYCAQVHSLSMGDGMEPGSYFMKGLKLEGRDLRRGSMVIPNGPSLPGGVFWLNNRQVELRAFGANEIWERVR